MGKKHSIKQKPIINHQLPKTNTKHTNLITLTTLNFYSRFSDFYPNPILLFVQSNTTKYFLNRGSPKMAYLSWRVSFMLISVFFPSFPKTSSESLNEIFLPENSNVISFYSYSFNFLHSKYLVFSFTLQSDFLLNFFSHSSITNFGIPIYDALRDKTAGYYLSLIYENFLPF